MKLFLFAAAFGGEGEVVSIFVYLLNRFTNNILFSLVVLGIRACIFYPKLTHSSICSKRFPPHRFKHPTSMESLGQSYWSRVKHSWRHKVITPISYMKIWAEWYRHRDKRWRLFIIVSHVSVFLSSEISRVLVVSLTFVAWLVVTDFYCFLFSVFSVLLN